MARIFILSQYLKVTCKKHCRIAVSTMALLGRQRSQRKGQKPAPLPGFSMLCRFVERIIVKVKPFERATKAFCKE